jgi:hypothetical protein
LDFDKYFSLFVIYLREKTGQKEKMSKFLKLYNQFLFGFVLLLLIFIPLYPKFPIFNIRGTFVAIRAEDFLIALFIVLCGIYILLKKDFKKFLSCRLVQFLLVFFFIGAVSLFSAYFVTHTIKPHLAVLHYLRRIELMILLPLVFWIIQSKKQIYICLSVLCVVTIIVIFYAFGQQFLGWPVISTTNSEFSKGQILRLTPDARVNSTFAGHYDLAVFLMMMITILSGLFWGIKKIWYRVIELLIMGLSFMVLVMTAARQSFVAVIIGVICSMLLAGKKFYILIIIVLAVVALLYPSQLRDRFMSTLIVNFQDQGNRFEAKNGIQDTTSRLNIPTLSASRYSRIINSTASATQSGIASDIAPGEPTDATQLGVYRSFEIRLNLEWPTAMHAFAKNPLLGTGYSSLGIATDNDILRSLGEVGLFGTLAFVYILLYIFIELWGLISQNSGFTKYFSIGVFSMVIAFILNSLFIDVFEASKVATLFWMIVGINLALTKIEK